jgi:hypothetical protein
MQLIYSNGHLRALVVTVSGDPAHNVRIKLRDCDPLEWCEQPETA